VLGPGPSLVAEGIYALASADQASPSILMGTSKKTVELGVARAVLIEPGLIGRAGEPHAN